MHQVVTAQLAARRAGTQSTKTRAEVRGGGAKPWRRRAPAAPARARSAHRSGVGGGVALGPKPRSYAQRTPKKMIRLALRSALSDRAADGKVLVVDEWGFDAPEDQGRARRRSRRSASTVGVLVVLGDDDERGAGRASATSPDVASCCSSAGELNAYDVLVQRLRRRSPRTRCHGATPEPRTPTPEPTRRDGGRQ